MFVWDPNPDLLIVPILRLPIKWYGFLFALGFALCFPLLRGILSRGLSSDRDYITKIIDRLTLYVVLGTILGARLGHLLFYEHPQDYLLHPLRIFWIREGGLASHGGALGIFVALALFSSKMNISWTRLLDFLAPCAALVAVFIRIGNFINQEVLGTPSHLPWAVLFMHPQDGSFPIPRHPVQLYEAVCYLFLFVLLWRMTVRPKYLLTQGRLIGLFLILCFGSRFLIEFFKMEQSSLWNGVALLSVGQWLSLPFIALGYLFLKRSTCILNAGEKL
jgi:phosphatidylglycerol---prolipoprotein diacylglyceryl transferase